MSRPVRIGVVGGGFAATSHLDALRRLPGVEVAVLVGSSDARARVAADRLGIPRSTGELQGVLSDPRIDAVHDCTPNHLHAQVNSAVLSAGKHLVAEKPLGLDSAETAELARQAEAADVVSAVCFNYRYFPMPRQVRSWLGSGDVGAPHLIHGSYLQDWLLHPTDWNWRLDSETAGRSRAVADIGSHWMDLIQFVTGRRIEAVVARLGRLHERRIRPPAAIATFERPWGEGEEVPVDTEDAACVLFSLEGGCPGSLTVSQVSPGRKNHLTFEIDTPAAAFAWDQEEPNQLWIGRRDGPNEVLLRDPSLLGPDAAALARFPGGHQEGWPDALRNMLEDFYAAVDAHDAGRERRSSLATFADAHRMTLAVEAILESDRSGRWETVSTPTEVHR
jgi:predicted dehydrogenase